MKDCLTNNTFLVYAMKMYSNPLCTGIEEFQEDISRIKYIKRLLLKYKKTRVLKTRLILNHVIVMQNMFGAEACVRILFFKIPKAHTAVFVNYKFQIGDLKIVPYPLYQLTHFYYL